LRTQTVDFVGQEIQLLQEVDAKNRGIVYNIGANQMLEKGSINANISRNNSSNSFGGLDVTERVALSYTHRLNELWNYNLDGAVSDVETISVNSGITDRQTITLAASTRYLISKNWSLIASYRFTTRKFQSDASDDRAPHSNRIYAGFTYNFPPLSSF
jgi:long-subunit fatty acid transport protein